MDAQTASHLRLISIFHYVLAGLAFLFSLVPGIYIGLGVAFLSGAIGRNARDPPPPEIGWASSW